MSCAPEVVIGPFVVGEIPFTLVYTYLDQNGASLDLSGGYTAKFVYRNGAGEHTVNATITNATAGQVSYQWTGPELDSPGRWTAEFWVGNGGTTKLASSLIRYTVRQPVGTVPSL